MTDNQLAREAYEAAKGHNPSLNTNNFAHAESLVKQAYDYLEARDRYKPKKHARPIAEQAVLEFVRARLLKQQPENDPAFVQQRMQWRSAAAVEYHYEDTNGDIEPGPMRFESTAHKYRNKMYPNNED